MQFSLRDQESYVKENDKKLHNTRFARLFISDKSLTVLDYAFVYERLKQVQKWKNCKSGILQHVRNPEKLLTWLDVVEGIDVGVVDEEEDEQEGVGHGQDDQQRVERVSLVVQGQDGQ